MADFTLNWPVKYRRYEKQTIVRPFAEYGRDSKGGWREFSIDVQSPATTLAGGYLASPMVVYINMANATPTISVSEKVFDVVAKGGDNKYHPIFGGLHTKLSSARELAVEVALIVPSQRWAVGPSLEETEAEKLRALYVRYKSLSGRGFV